MKRLRGEWWDEEEGEGGGGGGVSGRWTIDGWWSVFSQSGVE